ncbi:Ku protein [Actinomadura yumaensis]|uniref:Non-homologous end joining protein Ku n=1 Tax=Actinomadura yumaensis TaxID=111807 RepID=A0ABW2CBE2_9ACTN
MRSIWKGAISFGLVTIPVKVYSATEQRDVAFHQVHRQDGGRIKYKRVCSVDGEEVPYSDIAKGYELPSGEMVVLTDEDFADLPLSSSRRIDVLQFVEAAEVDPIYFAKSYYLEPDGAQGAKPYVLLRDALEDSGQVAIVKIALRQRESLATVRVREGVFVLETMLWPDEVRAPDFPFLDEDIEVRKQELTMATSLIESMEGDFDPSEYKDAYREALQAVIDAKVEGREVTRPAAEAEEEPAADLLSALRASVEAAKKSRGGGGAKKPAAKSGGRAASSKSSGSGRSASRSSSGRTSRSASSSSGSSSSASRSSSSRKAGEKKTESKPRRRKSA